MPAHDPDTIWRAKVAAWVHDPPEKALVLMRTPEGHEGGTVRALCADLFDSDGLPADLEDVVRRADRAGAAADRPQFPREGRFGPRVVFAEEPILVHPLSGTRFDLGKLEDVPLPELKGASADVLRGLVVDAADAGPDWRRTALRFWRLARERAPEGFGALWGMLPADTRVPDHSIWEHLSLTSAFAGAMAGGDRPALLAVQLGPVQGFIASARSTSDLWAGSHLLSTLAWEAMKVVCEALGPDAVLMPSLWGVPAVDAWLLDAEVVDAKDPALGHLERSTDANPLFAAALPNRFVALVPWGQAEALGERIVARAREAARDMAEGALVRLAEQADIAPDAMDVARAQVDAQLSGFPEVAWAAAPWPATELHDGVMRPEAGFAGAVARFYPDDGGSFLDDAAWKTLSRAIDLDGARFYLPNEGTLYPAVYDLSQRLLAAARAAQPARQLPQHGYRCTLCGEREWLTLDRALLVRHVAKRKGERLWSAVANKRRSWAREGEALCGVCTLKRVWPAIFIDDVDGVVARVGGKAGSANEVSRYVVSTHTMALATTLDALCDHIRKKGPLDDRTREAVARIEQVDRDRTVGVHGARAVLPRRLAETILPAARSGDPVAKAARMVPALLDDIEEARRSGHAEEERDADHDLRAIRGAIKTITGRSVEAYYALVLMDGDRMGAWLSGAEHTLTHEASWHPKAASSAADMAQGSEALRRYLETPRPISPARHAAISAALNGFALHVAPHVTEEIFKGKILYAGGDDLMAMASVDDLLGVMLGLRLAYGGVSPDGDGADTWRAMGARVDDPGLRLRRGHALLGSGGAPRVLRMMGPRATASVGAVVAHHMAPLGAVLREVRAAEKRAKEAGGRDAFCITLVKRSGGSESLVCPWLLGGVGAGAGRGAQEAADPATVDETAMGVLIRLRDAFAFDVSRRAAYHVATWLADLDGVCETDPAGGQRLLETAVGAQLRRQRRTGETQRAKGKPDALDALARDAVALAAAVVAESRGGATPALAGSTGPDGSRTTVAGFLRGLVMVAEFLARESRLDAPDHVAGEGTAAESPAAGVTEEVAS